MAQKNKLIFSEWRVQRLNNQNKIIQIDVNNFLSGTIYLQYETKYIEYSEINTAPVGQHEKLLCVLQCLLFYIKVYNL